MSLGARLTRLRLEKGETLQEVADAVGVSKAHIWELEKGRTDNPSMALVTRFADHFGLSLATLVGEEPGGGRWTDRANVPAGRRACARRSRPS